MIWGADFSVSGDILLTRPNRGPPALDAQGKAIKVEWQVKIKEETTNKEYTFNGNPNWQGTIPQTQVSEKSSLYADAHADTLLVAVKPAEIRWRECCQW